MNIKPASPQITSNGEWRYIPTGPDVPQITSHLNALLILHSIAGSQQSSNRRRQCQRNGGSEIGNLNYQFKNSCGIACILGCSCVSCQ
jgi:hypothetical protein